MMPSMRQCNREDIHADRRAWFGVWPTGVPPPRHHTLSPDNAPFITSQSPTPRWTKEQCSEAACNGFTAKGCPYRHCASHCRKAGGCTKHKVPVAALSHSPIPSSSANQPLAIAEYQNIATPEEEALMAGLEASRLHTSTSSMATSYASSSRVTVLSAAGSSASHSPARPRISLQLGVLGWKCLMAMFKTSCRKRDCSWQKQKLRRRQRRVWMCCGTIRCVIFCLFAVHTGINTIMDSGL